MKRKNGIKPVTNLTGHACSKTPPMTSPNSQNPPRVLQIDDGLFDGNITYTCTVFGCGRTLSMREEMFGNKCIKHQR